MKFTEAKSILSKLKITDSLFGISYSMNLYRGCQHGCIYCDTRSECYGINDISAISLKTNAPELLVRELKAKRKSRGTIGTGSMNDPYMPVEKEFEMTRRALRIIAGEKFPVHVITKSDLVVRDADILQDIAKVYAAVSFTITSADDGLSSIIEPYAPPSSARFRAMELLASKGIYTGVTLMPVLPYINDTTENIVQIVKMAKDSGAQYIIPMFGVTMRKGSRDYFYKAMDAGFPGLKERYMMQFGESYVCNSPQYQELERAFRLISAKLAMPSKMKFYEPPVTIQETLF